MALVIAISIFGIGNLVFAHNEDEQAIVVAEDEINIIDPTLDPVLNPVLDSALSPALDPILNHVFDSMLNPALDPVWPEWESWQPQTTYIRWTGITYGQSFFDLYINVNWVNYYAGKFFGENLCQYERTDAPDDALTFFRGTWTGAGSEFYIKRKSETEIAVMYHDIPYRDNPYDFSWDDYEEILVIFIDSEKEIEIGEPMIYKFSHHLEPVGSVLCPCVPSVLLWTNEKRIIF